MSRFAVDDDVELTPNAKSEAPAGDTSRREFWKAHAQYWRERGNEAKAAECDAMAQQRD